MSTPETSPSFIGRVKSLYAASAEDYNQTGLVGKAVLGCTAISLAFEWGTGNEALISAVGANAYRVTDNPLLSGIGAGLTSFAEQGAFGALMAASLHYFPTFAHTVRSFRHHGHQIEAEGVETIAKKRSILGRFMAAFALGSSVETAVDNTRNARTFLENIKRSTEDAAMIGTGVMALVSGAGGIIDVGSHLGLEREAADAINILSNPLFYVGIFASVFTYKHLRKAVHARHHHTPKHASGVVTQIIIGSPGE